MKYEREKEREREVDDSDDHYSGDYFSLLLLSTDLEKKCTHTRYMYDTCVERRYVETRTSA